MFNVCPCVESSIQQYNMKEGLISSVFKVFLSFVVVWVREKRRCHFELQVFRNLRIPTHLDNSRVEVYSVEAFMMCLMVLKTVKPAYLKENSTGCRLGNPVMCLVTYLFSGVQWVWMGA